MAFLDMLGHLAHPMTTPVCACDKCSFTLVMRTWSAEQTYAHRAVWAPYTTHEQDMSKWTSRGSFMGFDIQKTLPLHSTFKRNEPSTVTQHL